MANTIQLKLLENKSIVAEVNGRNYAYEGGYNIVAGEQNATEFEIVSVPAQYADFTFSVTMTNSRGQNVEPPEIVDNKFMLPIGMAVAGYGQIVITALGVNENNEPIIVPFLPLKIKVANTKANWTSGVISGTITIGTVETLLPDEKAYAVDVGTATDAIINFGIPQGEKGKDGKDALPIKILGEVYYNPDLTYEWSTTDLLPLPSFNITEQGTAFLVDDNEVKGQYDLYVHNYEAEDWVVINNWGGIPGEQGVGISSIVANGTDSNGGNIYKITLTNGEAYNFTAPKGPTGATGAMPEITVGTVITLPAGSQATVTNSGTAENVVLNFGIPKGEDGEGATVTVDAALSSTSTNPVQNKVVTEALFNGTYAICSTSATAAKEVTKAGFTLVEGARITVKFANANTVNSPTLNVNGTGAKPIQADGDTTYVKWIAGAVMDFVYDGTNWVVVGGYQLAGKFVGIICISTITTSPAVLFGGTWTSVESGYYLKAITSGLPAYGGAGLPNIIGFIGIGKLENISAGATGAFSVTHNTANQGNIINGSNYGTGDNKTAFEFNASAGAEAKNVYGKSTTVTPKHYDVYMWRRTA